MKHVSELAGSGWRARLQALRDKAHEGRYSCRTCRDLGLIHAQSERTGAVGVVPCPACKAGGEKHIVNNTCQWARGNRPCALCGAHEGEMVPAGYTPRMPAGFRSLEELANGELPGKPDDECPF